MKLVKFIFLLYIFVFSLNTLASEDKIEIRNQTNNGLDIYLNGKCNDILKCNCKNKEVIFTFKTKGLKENCGFNTNNKNIKYHEFKNKKLSIVFKKNISCNKSENRKEYILKVKFQNNNSNKTKTNNINKIKKTGKFKEYKINLGIKLEGINKKNYKQLIEKRFKYLSEDEWNNEVYLEVLINERDFKKLSNNYRDFINKDYQDFIKKIFFREKISYGKKIMCITYEIHNITFKGADNIPKSLNFGNKKIKMGKKTLFDYIELKNNCNRNTRRCYDDTGHFYWYMNKENKNNIIINFKLDQTKYRVIKININKHSLNPSQFKRLNNDLKRKFFSLKNGYYIIRNKNKQNILNTLNQLLKDQRIPRKFTYSKQKDAYELKLIKVIYNNDEEFKTDFKIKEQVIKSGTINHYSFLNLLENKYLLKKAFYELLYDVKVNRINGSLYKLKITPVEIKIYLDENYIKQPYIKIFSQKQPKINNKLFKDFDNKNRIWRIKGPINKNNRQPEMPDFIIKAVNGKSNQYVATPNFRIIKITANFYSKSFMKKRKKEYIPSELIFNNTRNSKILSKSKRNNSYTLKYLVNKNMKNNEIYLALKREKFFIDNTHTYSVKLKNYKFIGNTLNLEYDLIDKFKQVFIVYYPLQHETSYRTNFPINNKGQFQNRIDNQFDEFQYDYLTKQKKVFVRLSDSKFYNINSAINRYLYKNYKYYTKGEFTWRNSVFYSDKRKWYNDTTDYINIIYLGNFSTKNEIIKFFDVPPNVRVFLINFLKYKSNINSDVKENIYVYNIYIKDIPKMEIFNIKKIKEFFHEGAL